MVRGVFGQPRRIAGQTASTLATAPTGKQSSPATAPRPRRAKRRAWRKSTTRTRRFKTRSTGCRQPAVADTTIPATDSEAPASKPRVPRWSIALLVISLLTVGIVAFVALSQASDRDDAQKEQRHAAAALHHQRVITK